MSSDYSFEIQQVDLDNLDADDVEARLLRMESLTEGLGAGVEVRSGVVHDFVLRLQSILGQALSDRMGTVGSSLNPLAAPIGSTVESDVLDATAAFYGIDRLVASANVGQITVVVSAKQTTFIPQNGTFISDDGRLFQSLSPFAARTVPSEVQTNFDRLLVQRPDGKYEFTIDAQSVDPGEAGVLLAGSELATNSFAVPNFVTAFASTAFTGGLDNESDADLIERLRRLVPARSLSSRASVTSYLTEPDAFPTTLAISTIGFGDEELVRAKRLGVCSSGGSADIYMRNQALPSQKATLADAQVVSVSTDGKAIWQFTLNRDTAPGFYRVIEVRTADGDILEVTSLQRGMDLTDIPGEQTPRIVDTEDAAFSRYQTATVQVCSAAGALVVGDNAQLTVEFEYQPEIAEAQTRVGQRAYRFVGGDTLVRAAVPVYTSVAVTVHVKPGVTLPEADAVRSAIANYFNTSGFPGKLHTSRVASIVNSYLPTGADVATVEVILETLRPNGSVDRRRQTGEINTLNEPSNAVTPRTCVFYCDPTNVVVSAYQENTPTSY